jgi:homoserine O-acetyltransferase/O-succinyltransferase
MRLLTAVAAVAVALTSFAATAQDVPARKEGTWIARDFKFHTGENMPELRLHYTTIGDPKGEPVLVLHGTTGSGAGLANNKAFGGELFGAGQPLDAAKYFVILPDAIGHGKSSRPSDGMKTKFPRYNLQDMVDAQYRLVTEGLGIKRLRLVIGNSMGGMHAWLWGVSYPDAMDAIVPMASQPSPMAARNWILRRMMLETIRNDPAYKNGEYTEQPPYLKIANVFFALATNGGTLAYHQLAPNREKADALVDARLKAPMNADANDFVYQWDSSRDYDPSPGLEKIKAAVLAINAADDERNPPETGVTEREMKRIKNARLLLIPASNDTRGHATTGMARFWKEDLRKFLDGVPRGQM